MLHTRRDKSKIKLKILLAFLAVALLFSGCSAHYEQETYFALDTYIQTNLPRNAPKDLYRYIVALESMLSKTETAGELYALNAGDTLSVSSELYELIARSCEISQKTDGAFDASIGNVTALWDFKSSEPDLPNDGDIADALENSGYEKIRLENGSVLLNGTNIDLGGIAKGYIAQKCVEYLHECDINGGLLNFGGNIAIAGAKPNGEPWRIALKDPINTSQTVGTLTAESGYISVSGDYERYFEKDGKRYHHIIDTESGMPVDNGIACVAVLCDDGVLADALSTALFAMGLDRALEFYDKKIYDYEAIIITKNRYIYISGGLSDVFTLTSDEYAVQEQTEGEIP